MATDDSLGRTLLFVVAAVLLVAVLLPLLMMSFAMPMMGFGMGVWDGRGIPGATWPWLLAWLVHLALVLAIGYVLYRAFRGSTGRKSDPALEELRAAYARGELTSEEFEERRERLERGERSR